MLKVPEKSIKNKEKYIAQGIKSFSRLHQKKERKKEKFEDGKL